MKAEFGTKRTEWVPTNEHYHRILAAPDAATREQRYIDLLVQHWKAMMDMMSAFGPAQNHPLAGARVWVWLLPDQVEEMAAVLRGVPLR